MSDEFPVVVRIKDTVKAVYLINNRKSGIGGDIINSEDLYDFVANINRQLIEKEKKGA